jgi:dipeptidyl aminopeptidase/acylaminoacyl peptidase
MLKEFITLEADGNVLAGWLYLPEGGGKYPAVCLCHGIPSGKPPEPGDGGYPALAETVCREGFAVMFFNFRGTGDSGGDLDILGWTRDLRAAVDYLYQSPGVDGSRLWLVGFSAGAATSVYVASHDKRVSGVAACACPADFSLILDGNGGDAYLERFREMGAIKDAGFPLTVEGWLDNFREVTRLHHVAGIAPRPLLLVHGSADETVPVNDARRLYGEAGEPKQLVILEGAGHRLRREPGAVRAVLDWLRFLIDRRAGKGL